MNDSLFGFSLDEVNSDPERLKIVLINYSSNVKSYAKWFEINEIDKNEDKFTLYKVVYRLLPKNLNESVKEVAVWKRFRDFKELYEFMYNYHASLHRKDKFPDFPKAKYFNRFDDQVITERKQASLRLLQFIGSQSHLYRHQKFIDFLSDGKFFDLAKQNEDKGILRPLRSDKDSPIDRLKNLNAEIKNHLDNQCQDSNFVDAYLEKTVKLIELAIENENSDYHLTTLKFLNNSTKILSDCVNELERSNCSNARLVFMRSINSKLIDVTRVLSEKNRQSEETKVKGDQMDRSPSGKFLNDWVLSDFNLKSDDFSNELSFISGNLFDLNFNFKLCRLLNYNCFLLQSRFDQNTNKNQKFILKRLAKSNNPKVSKKSIVPFANKIPYMCQLHKYYESDTTIFLLVEFYELGLLYNHLSFFYQNPENFLKNLKNVKKLTRQESSETIRENSLHRRNSLSTIHINYSSTNQPSKQKRRTQSEIHQRISIQRLESFSENQLTEVNLPDLKLCEVASSQSASSTSSLSDVESKNDPHKVVISVKNENKKIDKIKNFLKFKSNDKKSVVFFKLNSSETNSQNQLSKSDSQSSHDEKANTQSGLYVKQVKFWLAQLIIAVKNLHKVGLVLKDLNWRNLLLNKNGMLLLTYFSSWNLVERKLSNSALDELYVAPELNGLVNYDVSKVCDWWSVGVIAYEMFTQKRFSDVHSSSQIYVENILFPENFKNKNAQNFIRQMLRLDPSERLGIEQIESHSLFKNIDWTNLENVFWTSR